jgi:hypothetical protein
MAATSRTTGRRAEWDATVQGYRLRSLARHLFRRTTLGLAFAIRPTRRPAGGGLGRGTTAPAEPLLRRTARNSSRH